MNYFLRCTRAFTKAGFLGMLRSPSFVVFSIAFPLVFIISFGFIGDGFSSLSIAFTPSSDRDNAFFQSLEETPNIEIIEWDEKQTEKQLILGEIDAIFHIDFNQQRKPAYKVDVRYSTSSPENAELLKIIIENLSYKLNGGLKKMMENVAVNQTIIIGKKSSRIDFILPGQLGFSLMSAGVFGTAFAFVMARKLLVMKKYFTTPVSKYAILLGETLSRILFSLLSAAIIVGFGYYFFDFTLQNGWVSFFNIMVLSAISLFLFLGVGLFISSVVNEEKNVPPLANIFTLPQFLISGTFFPISVYPDWLQKIALILPLTYVNEGLRKISFDGASLWDIKYEILVILIWTIAVFIISSRVFKWK